MRYPWWDLSYSVEQIFAEVWVSTRIARPFPTHYRATPRHTSRALGSRYRRPTIRSWLGNRRTSGTKPNSLKGTIMKKLLALTLASLTLASTIAACTPDRQLSELRPTSSATFTCDEDMPCWDPRECAEIGNQICGEASDAGTAWKVYEREGGNSKLKLDPSRPYRVDYMVSTPEYPENLDTYDLVLVGTDGRYYVFRASYTD